MKILLTNRALADRGGSESYLETIAQGLRQLEHEVIFYSPRLGSVARRLRTEGYDVFDDVAGLPDDFDVIHGQHVDGVSLVRGRFPAKPLLFACHSWFLPVELPVSDLGADAFLAFNDLTAARLRAHAATAGKPVHRLTQPVTISFADTAREPVRAEPRQTVAVSRVGRTRMEQLAAACRARGIAFTGIGLPGHESTDPRGDMLAADIVFAVGRSALEAAAAARTVLLIDETTIGGWLDDSTYEHAEAAGFTGVAEHGQVGTLDDLLDDYRADRGAVARRLVVEHHAVQLHVTRLVELYRELAGPGAGSVDFDSLHNLGVQIMAFEERATAADWNSARHLREIEVLRARIRDLEG